MIVCVSKSRRYGDTYTCTEHQGQVRASVCFSQTPRDMANVGICRDCLVKALAALDAEVAFRGVPEPPTQVRHIRRLK